MYCGYIIELKGLRKHTNADRLQCAEVFGNSVVVDLSYYDGQKCVYFPSDGKLGEKFAKENNLLRIKDESGKNIGGYLDPEKRNIRAIKLRGEKSDGLVLPIESLKKFTDITKLNVGDKITTLGGEVICEKYIPVRKNRTSGSSGKSKSNSKNSKKESKINYPYFKEHVDTEQLAYNKGAFKEGDLCTITLKCHGSSHRIANTEKITKKPLTWWQKLLRRQAEVQKEWGYVSGTRRTVINSFEEPGGYYGTNAFRKPYHDFFKDKLEKGEEIYFEICGWVDTNRPIMAIGDTKKLKDPELTKLYGDQMVFDYGCERGQNRIFVYRMTMTNEDGYVVEYPDWLMRLRCEQMGVDCVPLFETFRYTTWEDLMERVEKYYDGPDPIGKTHVREGVVVRIQNRATFTAYKHKNISFKIIEGLIKDTADAPDMEEAEELLRQQEAGENDEPNSTS